jgi:hypothetical protein
MTAACAMGSWPHKGLTPWKTVYAYIIKTSHATPNKENIRIYNNCISIHNTLIPFTYYKVDYSLKMARSKQDKACKAE